jgi:hypothetical protein
MARIATVGLLALAALLAHGAALAEERNGSAQIHEVRLAASAVVLDGEVYHVSDTTRIEDENGAELSLGALPSLAGGGSGDAVAVWFEAGEERADHTRPLTLLRLTGGMPQ